MKYFSILLFFLSFRSYGGSLEIDVMFMKTYPECKSFLEKSIELNKAKDFEIADLKHQLKMKEFELERHLIEAASRKK